MKSDLKLIRNLKFTNSDDSYTCTSEFFMFVCDRLLCKAVAMAVAVYEKVVIKRSRAAQ